MVQASQHGTVALVSGVSCMAEVQHALPSKEHTWCTSPSSRDRTVMAEDCMVSTLLGSTTLLLPARSAGGWQRSQ